MRPASGRVWSQTVGTEAMNRAHSSASRYFAGLSQSIASGDSKTMYSASWRQRVPRLIGSSVRARKFFRFALSIAPCV